MQLPNNPEQWYNRNNQYIFRAELYAMRVLFPEARFGFLNTTGDMYWIVDVKLPESVSERVWRLMVIYDNNHGEKNGLSSISVVPIKPSYEDLKEIIHDIEYITRKRVPHTYENKYSRCLDATRFVQDTLNSDGKILHSAAWHINNVVNNWIIRFEMGIRDQKIWDDWCGR